MFFGKKEKKKEMFDVNSKVDFTLLDSRATNNDLEKLCNIAYKNQYGAVCVNPANVSYVSGYIAKNFGGQIKVVSVVGFPLGANSTNIKVAEAKEAIDCGADEIDVVINIGKAKAGDFAYVKKEIEKIRKATKHKVLKVILDVAYFDENDIIKLSKICMACKVDYVKTSTGFSTGGATPEVVSLIKKVVGSKCKIKASGGVKTREQAVNFLNLGADRIGTSSII